MAYTIADNGDALEKEFSDFITMHIPNYEFIWSIFIGNNGTANLAPMDNTTNDIDKLRQNIGEINYSILEALVSIWFIKEKYQANSFIKVIKDVVDTNNDLILFLAQIGRIGDLINNAKEELSISKSSVLEDFYQQRNSIVHGRRIPYSQISGEIEIPEISTAKDITSVKLGTWYDRKNRNDKWYENWTSYPIFNKILLKDFYKDTFAKFYPIVDSEFSLILNEVKNIIAINSLLIKQITPTVSSSGETGGISGYKPPLKSDSTGDNTSSGYGVMITSPVTITKK